VRPALPAGWSMPVMFIVDTDVVGRISELEEEARSADFNHRRFMLLLTAEIKR